MVEQRPNEQWIPAEIFIVVYFILFGEVGGSPSQTQWNCFSLPLVENIFLQTTVPPPIFGGKYAETLKWLSYFCSVFRLLGLHKQEAWRCWTCDAHFPAAHGIGTIYLIVHSTYLSIPLPYPGSVFQVGPVGCTHVFFFFYSFFNLLGTFGGYLLVENYWFALGKCESLVW